jgi:hypothetical protein
MKKDDIVGPLFFQEAPITSHSYLNMLEEYTVPHSLWFTVPAG